MLVRMDESFLRRRDVNIGMTFPRRKEMLLRYLNLPIFVHSSAHLWIKVSSGRAFRGGRGREGGDRVGLSADRIYIGRFPRAR